MSGEKKYRDVTKADIGKMVEVRDRESDGWILGKLRAIYNGSPVPYECLNRWKHARISVEEEPKVEAKPEAPNEKRYRDVTEADIGKMVEVRDNLCDPWHTDRLKRINYKDIFQYKCDTQNWRYARIAVAEEEAKVEAPEANPEPCKPDPGEGYRLLSKDPPEEVIEGDEYFDQLEGEWKESDSWKSLGRQGLLGWWYRRKIEVPPEAKPEPWKPKVGDKVKITRKNSMFAGHEGTIIRDDGKHAEPYYVEFDKGFGWYAAGDLGPVDEAESEKDFELWTPSCGDWVLITKPENPDAPNYFWDSAMDYLNGSVQKITRINMDDLGVQVTEIDGSGWWLNQEWLTPCEEPKNHIVDANKKAPLTIPEGWRELQEGEFRLRTDLFDYEGKWTSFDDYNPEVSNQPYDKRIHKKHIRKIEVATEAKPADWKPKVGERVKVRAPREGDLLAEYQPWMSWIGMEFDVGWINWQNETVLPYTAGHWIKFDWLEPVETFPPSQAVEAVEPLVGKQSPITTDYVNLPQVALRLVAQCRAYGVRKYGVHNHEAITERDHINHAITHVFKHLEGDHNEDHLVHAVLRLMFAIEDTHPVSDYLEPLN